ncbi:hypothetical protein Y032_0328g2645 [Ancylostoma ceylanicum]|uniref:Uncharacterized protein n=1 Tax=Ancylostoma ceylanicum TaxID=53326 RepID=A0A016RZY2_9BILA|nr:hypothetical protein Y032_0328g2645 [Ancylostoma ceylanicum]
MKRLQMNRGYLDCGGRFVLEEDVLHFRLYAPESQFKKGTKGQNALNIFPKISYSVCREIRVRLKSTGEKISSK